MAGTDSSVWTAAWASTGVLRALWGIVTSDPKPAKRVRLGRTAYLKAAREFLAAHPSCECGCGRRSESVALAGDGVRLCHGALTSRTRVWDNGFYIDPLEVATGIRRTLETSRRDCLEYVLERKGRDYLDRTYPQRVG